MNGESTSMVWPTLGSRTAKEQKEQIVSYHRTLPVSGADDQDGIPRVAHTSWLSPTLLGTLYTVFIGHACKTNRA